MKTPLLSALLVLSAVALGSAFPDDAPSADEVAVRAAIEDYVLGFYRAEPDRLERSVAQELKKMGYWRADAAEDYQGPMHMNHEQALALARSWNADGRQGGDLAYEIVLHEVADKTATGKLTAKWGQDYFQLAKQDGRWRIHHVMWQSASGD